MIIHMAKYILFISFLLLQGCASTQPPASSQPTVNSQTEKVIAYPSLSLNHFIADLFDVLNAQDQQAYVAMWDTDKFADRSIALIEGNDYSAAKVREILNKESVFIKVTNSNLDIFKDSQLVLLETDVTPLETPQIKVAIHSEEDNLYVGFVLRSHNGGYKIIDFYDYAMGVFQSQKSAELFDNYLTNSINAEATMQTLAQSIQASANSEPQRAIEILKTIPEPILSQKGMLTNYIVAASEDQTELIKALELLEKYHADDPSVSFMMAQLYYLRKQNVQSIEAFKTFASIIGSAPQIQIIIANLYLENDDIDNAISHANKAIRIDSQTSLAYWTLAKAFIRNNDLDDAFFALKILQSYFGYEFTASGLYAEKEMKPLFELASFKDWIKTLPE